MTIVRDLSLFSCDKKNITRKKTHPNQYPAYKKFVYGVFFFLILTPF